MLPMDTVVSFRFFRGHLSYSNPTPHFTVEKPKAPRGHVNGSSCTAPWWQGAGSSPQLALCHPLSIWFYFSTAQPTHLPVFA